MCFAHISPRGLKQKGARRTLSGVEQFEPVNVLGAAGMAVMDGIWAALAPEIGHPSDAAALVAIGHAPGLSNDGLRQVLRLSHPGAVRLADRLVAAGLVERRTANARRAVSLHVTPKGTACRTALLAARKTVLERMLAPLQAHERDTLAALLGKMLTAVPRDELQVLEACRLCDEKQCQNCPVVAGMDAT